MKVSGPLAEKGLHVFDHEAPVIDGVRLPHLWFIVADREKAYVYRKMVHNIEQIASLKPGHAHDDAAATGALPHGHDVRSEKRHHADSAFLQKLAVWIEKAANEKAFERLIIAAPPHALGDIRRFLGASARSRVVAEVNKDWIKLPTKEIEKHLFGLTLPRE